MLKMPEQPRRRGRPPAEVRAIPGSEHARDALKRFAELLAGAVPPRGVILVTVDGTDGNCQWRVYGTVKRQELAFVATEMGFEAVT